MVTRRVSLATLQQVADVAAVGVLNDLGIQAECVYLGQVSGSEPNKCYIEEPRDWIIGDGTWPSQQIVAFEWHWDGCIDVVEQLVKHAQRRGVRRPADLLSRKEVWCKTALEQLRRAATAFTDLHGQALLGEFGVQLQCNYKYQAGTMEHDPAS